MGRRYKRENENIFVFGLKSIIVERTAYAEKSKIRSFPTFFLIQLQI